MSEKETVNHPEHYNTGKFEVIAIIEDWKLGFHTGNAIKYIARAKHKGNELEDIKKAIWYLERYLKINDKTIPLEEQLSKLFNSLHKDSMKYENSDDKQKKELEKKYDLLKGLPKNVGKDSKTTNLCIKTLCEKYELCRIIYQDDTNDLHYRKTFRKNK